MANKPADKKNKVWQKTAHPGIFYREITDNTSKVTDKYFVGWYSVNRQRYQVAFGHKSLYGWTPAKCAEKMAEFRMNAKNGIKPRTFKELEELREAEKAKMDAKMEEQIRKATTLSEFWENYYGPSAKAEKKEQTYKREKNIYDNWLEPRFGNWALKDITTGDIELFKTDMLTGDEKEKIKPKSPRTVEYTLAVLRMIYNHAITLNKFDGTNPVLDVRKPKYNNQKNRFLSRKEAEDLLDRLREKSYQTYLLALAALHTGGRFNEISNLKWSDIDFETGVVTFRKTKNTETRSVPLTDRLKEELEKWSGESDYVFTSKKGGPVKYVSKIFYKTLKEMGLNDDGNQEKLNFHSLRHTYASWQVQAGVPIYTVSKLLGHKTMAMTTRYAHLVQDDLRCALKAFDRPGGKVIDFPSAKEA